MGTHTPILFHGCACTDDIQRARFLLCLHPRRKAKGHTTILLFIYLLTCGQNYTVLGEHVPKSFTDKVVTIGGDGVQN